MFELDRHHELGEGAAGSASGLPSLTRAEHEILKMVLAGCNNSAIARARSRSTHTVANQLVALFRKFGTCSRIELAARVVAASQPAQKQAAAPAKAPPAPPPPDLKPRELAMILLRAQGHSLKFIGYELGLASSTVSVRLRCAMQKLEIGSPFELCARFGAESR